jgi:hypothetical protein
MPPHLPPVSEEDRVLEHLQRMPEVELHKQVVHLLLKRLGATHVEYVHGSAEKGKDFIYVCLDFQRRPRLEVCQVKNTPFTGRAGDNHPGTVLNQLIQCRSYEVRNPASGKIERPRGVVLYSTYELPEKDIAGGRSLLDEIERNDCEFVGPVAFVRLVREYLPELYAEFAFPGGGVFRFIARYVNTHHEAEAFGLRSEELRPLAEFFVNLGVAQGGGMLERLAAGDVSPCSPQSMKISTPVYRDLDARFEALRPLLDGFKLFELETVTTSPHTPLTQRRRANRVPKLEFTRLRVIRFKEFLAATSTKLRSIPMATETDNPRLTEAVTEGIQLLTGANRLVEEITKAIKGDNTVLGTNPWTDPCQFDLPEVPTAALAELKDNLCVVGDAGAGKTSVARDLARLLLGRGVRCLYFPCSRLDTVEKGLLEAIREFLAELSGPGTQHNRLPDLEWLILDGRDEVACDPSSLANDVGEMAFPAEIKEPINHFPGYPPVIPADLKKSVKFEQSRGQTEKWFLIQRRVITSLDFARLVRLNLGTAYERPLLTLETRSRSMCPRVVLTTRPGSPVIGLDGFEVVKLTPFTDEQQRAFFERWFSSSPEDADAILGFLADNPRIREVCRAPIVATLVAALHQNGFSLPLTRTEVYSQRFDLLAGRWDRARRVAQRNHLLVRDKMTLLSRLALLLHEKHSRRFSRSQLAAIWRHGLARHYPRVTVDDLLTELRVSNSLIVAEGGGTYTLGHLSYQEYLAALAVVHEQRLQLLVEKFYDPHWRQVVIFYAGIAGNAEGLLDRVQQSSPLINQDGLMEELSQEARYTPEHVRMFIEGDELVPDKEETELDGKLPEDYDDLDADPEEDGEEDM